jgi:hypothetical protein
MTALTAARNTPERTGAILGFPVKGSTKAIQGGLAVLNAGYAAPGTTATGLVALGRFEETVDNTAGADGALNVTVKAGTFKFANSASADLIAQADAGADLLPRRRPDGRQNLRHQHPLRRRQGRRRR